MGYQLLIVNIDIINTMLSYICQHISANCNPMSTSLAFLDEDTIAFCFRDQVGLYSIKLNTITENINYRAVDINRANCICCHGQYILVGYDSGHLIAYTKLQNEWKITQIIKQQSAITCIYTYQNTLITINTAAQILLYSIDNQQKYNPITKTQSLKFPLNKMPESVVQIQHKGTNLIFIGGVDQKIYCYSSQFQQGTQTLHYRFQLSGHENAITKLAICQTQDDYLLASSSKDGYIRLWRITENAQIIKFHKNVKKYNNLNVFLDSVLISHQCSVTSLCWTAFNKKLQLISCSLDCTVCVWSCQSSNEKDGQNESTGAWTVETRMGQFLGNKNAYFNVTVDPLKRYLVAINYIGSALIWEYNEQNDKFVLRPSFNGHTNEVKDIDWDRSGNFLVSVSKDQTTRIISKSTSDNYFHQISRAQVHGYDINAVAVVQVNNNDKIIDLIACGADEKVIRIVQPPACFANYLNYFTKANLHLFFPNAQQEQKYIISKPQSQILQYETYAEGGTQVLGLMTKAQRVQRQKISSYYDDEQQQGQQQQQKQEKPKQLKANFSVPPHDDYLLKHTLWPQMNKLYGHPHEIAALAKNNKLKLLASACSGKNKIFCTIIVWSTQDWKIKKMIEYHAYTVYGMEFTNSGQYLVTGGKDRKLGVFDCGNGFQLVFGYEAHSRAITSVAVSDDSEFIITGSRDKSVKIHSIQEKKCIAEFQIKKQVDAVAFCGNKVVAVGCIDGTILFLSFLQGKLYQIAKIEDRYSHTKAVKKLRWKNGKLASCSDDHSVRVYSIKIGQ